MGEGHRENRSALAFLSKRDHDISPSPSLNSLPITYPLPKTETEGSCISDFAARALAGGFSEYHGPKPKIELDFDIPLKTDDWHSIYSLSYCRECEVDLPPGNHYCSGRCYFLSERVLYRFASWVPPFPQSVDPSVIEWRYYYGDE